MRRVARSCMGMLIVCFAVMGQAQDFEAIKHSAEQGNVSDQYNLGVMYANGLGVARNEAEAVKWYRKAAERGDADAQNNLGAMYAEGRGVAQSYAEAVKWYGKSAQQGNAIGQNNLGIQFSRGQGVAQNETEAAKWFYKAAEKGKASAQYNLGMAYAKGQGVAKNDTEAIKWYRKAADQGHPSAKKALEIMKNQTASSSQSALSSQEPLTLFGARLKNATRAQLRDAFKRTSLQVREEADQAWGDVYYGPSELLGINAVLKVGYTRAGQFAYAEYTLYNPSTTDTYINTQQVKKVVDRVAAKYGNPIKYNGNVDFGKVEAVWQRDGDIYIKVYRGWPDTTTYLRFRDPVTEGQMAAEMRAERASTMPAQE